MRIRIALGLILLVVVIGASLLAAGLDSHGRYGGYLPLVQYGPLSLLFLVGSFLPQRPRRR